jgi:hypothetical protein
MSLLLSVNQFLQKQSGMSCSTRLGRNRVKGQQFLIFWSLQSFHIFQITSTKRCKGVGCATRSLLYSKPSFTITWYTLLSQMSLWWLRNSSAIIKSAIEKILYQKVRFKNFFKFWIWLIVWCVNSYVKPVQFGWL